MAGTSRDLVETSIRDLLLGFGLDRDESEIDVDRAGGGGDVDGGSKVNVGAVTDHDDVGVDGSRLGLEDQLVPDSEVPTDGTI